MRAIDMHVHIPRQPGLPDMVIEESLRRYFRLNDPPRLAEELYTRYKEWDILGVVFSVDAETTTGDSPDTTTTWQNSSTLILNSSSDSPPWTHGRKVARSKNSNAP